jgi:hypothetical protein
MTDSRPALLCFDGSEDACRAIGDAGGLLAPRPAVVLTVWETARRLTALDPMGDAVGRESGIYADLDAAGLQAARDVVQRRRSSHRRPASSRARGWNAARCGRRSSRSALRRTRP